VVGLNVMLLVWALLVVKFLVIAFWMQDQMYQRAARFNIVAAMICLVAGGVYLRGLEALAFGAAVVAVVLGISSFRLVRIGRG
jgi:membrane-associated PAP2 superfamily phosphatase